MQVYIYISSINSANSSFLFQRFVPMMGAGVKSVDVDLKQQKVSVTGYADAKKVLKKAQSTKKKVELWPYVPYNLVAHPYVAGAYDKKAPPGYVRKVENPAVTAMTPVEEQYTTMFSDENPNACSIM